MNGFGLFKHIDNMLRRAVVIAARGATISSEELFGSERVAVDRSRGGVFRLSVVGRPTKIACGNGACIENRAELKEEERGWYQDSHSEAPWLREKAYAREFITNAASSYTPCLISSRGRAHGIDEPSKRSMVWLSFRHTWKNIW